MLMLLLAAAALDAGPVSSEPAVVEPATVKVDQGIGPVVTVELVGGITTVAAEFLQEAIEHAQEKNARERTSEAARDSEGAGQARSCPPVRKQP